MTTRRRHLLLALLAVLALALLIAAPAMGAAGGGSSGFSGGGERGGGRGAGIYILFQILIRLAVLGHGLGAIVIVAIVVAYLLIARVAPGARHARSAHEQSGRRGRRRVAKRSRRVELAAAEAAQDDPAFAPDRVKTAAAQLFTAVQQAWSAGDRGRLRALLAPGLAAEWERRLNDFEARGWRNQVAVVEPPEIAFVGIERRAEHGGRVTVRIEARLRDYVTDRGGRHIKRVGRLTETVRTREFWTLGRRGEPGAPDWRLESIEQGAEGAHALSGQIVPTPWSDTQALRDEALVEGAAADAVPAGTDVAELADLHFDGDARAAALDLSLADGRFAPDVLEVCARRAVAAWARAVDGDASALARLTAPGVLGELLHPGDPSGRTRVVVRGPAVREIRVTGFEPAARPPAMTVEVSIEGRRYLEDRATGRVEAGNPNRATRFTERWRMALTDDAAQPWRIAAVHAD